MFGGFALVIDCKLFDVYFSFVVWRCLLSFDVLVGVLCMCL